MDEDTCPHCRRPTTPVITEGGQHRDLDRAPVEGGNVVIIDDGTSIRGRVLTGTSGGPDGAQTYRMHRCPPPPPPPGPACDICTFPMMPREFVERTRQIRHAACEPEFLDQLELEQRQALARRRRRR